MRARPRGTGHLGGALAALILVVGCSSADASNAREKVATYEAALAPLKKRSDVLEERFAEVQGAEDSSAEELREVLAEIIPEYAALLERTRGIEAEGSRVERAHGVLLESLVRQQEGLELALRALDEDDATLMAEAGRALEEANELVKKHRSLLAGARG